MLARFEIGQRLLRHLVVCEIQKDRKADARLKLNPENDSDVFRFALESKSRSTSEAVLLAIAQAKSYAEEYGEHPLIQVPYLSPDRLEELEKLQVSGVDLCGNGVVIVPGRLYVMRTGNPNLFPDSRPLSNPYRGRSSMVARRLLQTPRWNSLSELAASFSLAGESLSLSQVSKAVQALKEDSIVSKRDGNITLIDPVRLLDNLGREWEKSSRQNAHPVRIPHMTDWIRSLSASSSLDWAVTGESSVARYTTFAQSGPRQIAVPMVDLAKTLLNAQSEPIPSFADLVLVESNSPGYYFDNEVDADGVRWASRLQTWLELQAGDARQQEAAKDLRLQLLRGL